MRALHYLICSVGMMLAVQAQAGRIYLCSLSEGQTRTHQLQLTISRTEDPGKADLHMYYVLSGSPVMQDVVVRYSAGEVFTGTSERFSSLLITLQLDPEGTRTKDGRISADAVIRYADQIFREKLGCTPGPQP